jgi:CBS domain-containing protein
MTTRVAALLQSKGHDVLTVTPESSVADLVQLLAGKRIGAVPVIDGEGHVRGIVSERDIVRALAADGQVLERKVATLMTRNVKTCGLQDAVVELMDVMTRERFRHLPVVENGRLVGIISIGDVVKQRVAEAQFELEALTSYINS